MFQSFEVSTNPAVVADRVAALREVLEARELDGFLVPRTDAFQGEFVAPHDERLAWLTGFTGSAGLAVVLADRAALLVDGRYTLQAAQQTDTQVFEIVPVHEVSAARWLEQALGSDAVVGYDPWLHGRTEIDRLAKAARRQGACLQPAEENPVDAIWSDQPPKPMGAIQIQPETLAGEGAGERRQRIGALVAKTGAGTAVLTQPDSLAWLLNIRGSDLPRSPVAQGFALLHADGSAALYMEPDKIGGDVLAHLGNQVSVTPPRRIAEGLAALAGETVLLDRATCPLWIASRLEAAGAKLEWGTDPCQLPKAVKNDAELAGMRAAHRRDGVAMARFLHWLDATVERGGGLTEIDVVKALEQFRAATGALMDISFDTICGIGPNGAIVHYRVNRASNRTLGPGELVLVDSGAQYQDGTTDITRTIAPGAIGGRGAEAGAIRPFTLVLKGMIAVSRARWPAGLTGRDLDPLARSALWRSATDLAPWRRCGAGARHDPVERAWLLRDRPLWNPHREPCRGH
jgi:Xaa-Pro aminopeptidase